MPERVHWPEWWEWEVEVTHHLLRRMAKRRFNELDMRIMLDDATGYTKDIDPDRYLVQTRWEGRDWELVVEPDPLRRKLAVITAYRIE
ncbi:MAG: hypothetical protein BWX88_00688 [Planctomycetes bacterium ADurb.Bin126]|nr:MAG: hypothetical protein BWX88_00688 [Planctomycetes bacterium ADurb.Bin126]HOD83974.1 hypothetical protein [Phycisphaerae bacterium]HQL72503.1 hypothetical protein [Phycisphaerae bacterium]